MGSCPSASAIGSISATPNGARPSRPKSGASLGHLSPTGTRDVRVTVALPIGRENYEIEFDLVQEHRAWFSGQGVPSSTTRVPSGTSPDPRAHPCLSR